MELRQIQFGSNGYEKMKRLRIEALLSPIGIPGSYIEPEKEKNDVFLGAFEDHEMIGCCILTRKDDDTVQLRQMAVHPSSQGSGLGTSILKFAETVAKQHGFKTVMMHARNQVIPFYQKSGYEITGNEFFEVGIGHHQMQKQI
jgi:N-acetylglutamate synthase-like GNAT family acetyltransferase